MRASYLWPCGFGVFAGLEFCEFPGLLWLLPVIQQQNKRFSDERSITSTNTFETHKAWHVTSTAISEVLYERFDSEMLNLI